MPTSDKYRIGIHGYTGAGKTTFLYGLLIKLREKGGSLNEKAQEYLDSLEKQREELNGVSATPQRIDLFAIRRLNPEKIGLFQDPSIKDLFQDLSIKNIELQLTDVQGETIEEQIKNKDKGLIKDVKKCGIYLFFLNPLAKPDKVKEHISEQINFAEQLIELVSKLNKGKGKKYVPFGFVITHKDEIDKLSTEDKTVVNKEIDRFKDKVLEKARDVYKETYKGGDLIKEESFDRFDLTQEDNKSVEFLIMELVRRKILLERETRILTKQLIKILTRIGIVAILILLAIGLLLAIKSGIDHFHGQQSEIQQIQNELQKLDNQYQQLLSRGDTGKITQLQEQMQRLQQTTDPVPTGFSGEVKRVLENAELNTSDKLRQINDLVKQNNNATLDAEILDKIDELVNSLIMERVTNGLVEAYKAPSHDINLTEAAVKAFQLDQNQDQYLLDLKGLKIGLSAFTDAENSEKLLNTIVQQKNYVVMIKYKPKKADDEKPFIACFVGNPDYKSNYYTSLCTVRRPFSGLSSNMYVCESLSQDESKTALLPPLSELQLYLFKPKIMKHMPGSYSEERDGKRRVVYPPVVFDKDNASFSIDEDHYSQKEYEEHSKEDKSLWPFGLSAIYKEKEIVTDNENIGASLSIDYPYDIPEIMWSIAEKVSNTLSEEKQ